MVADDNELPVLEDRVAIIDENEEPAEKIKGFSYSVNYVAPQHPTYPLYYYPFIAPKPDVSNPALQTKQVALAQGIRRPVFYPGTLSLSHFAVSSGAVPLAAVHDQKQSPKQRQSSASQQSPSPLFVYSPTAVDNHGGPVFYSHPSPGFIQY